MKNAFCWEKFAWAWSTVNTRCVFLKMPAMADMNRADCLALIPYLDLFNHSSTARVSMFGKPNVYISIVSFSIKYFTSQLHTVSYLLSSLLFVLLLMTTAHFIIYYDDDVGSTID